MQLLRFRDLKYLQYLKQVDAKFTQKEMTTTRQSLNSQIIKFQLNNPFILYPFPSINEAQLPFFILYMAKQMEEVNIKNLNLVALENFVSINAEPMKRLLIKEPFHCLIFCKAFIRYLTEDKELIEHVEKMRMTPFVDLFTSVLEHRKTQKKVKAVTIKQKQQNTLIHTVFIALMLTSCLKYIKEAEQEELAENQYLQKAIKAACLLIEQCQNQKEFKVLREYLSIISHLLIFNGMAVRPIKLLDFSLKNDQGLYFGVQHHMQVSTNLMEKYVNGLYAFCFLDSQCQQTLLKITRNLIVLNISNPALIAHFDVLLKLVKAKVFIGLKKQVFDVLLESQSKRNMAIIDEIFMHLLSSGIELIDDQIQSFSYMLAQSGQAKRKEQFALIYYFHYLQTYGKIHPQTINFILQVYFSQDTPLEKLELMVGREANVISSENMKKLHSLIAEKKQNIHINLLSIILEKRKDIGFKKGKKAATHPFICEEWLIAAGNNPQIYKTYLRILTQNLCGRTLQINPALINLSSCVVKTQAQYWSRSLEFYSILLKMAEKLDVYEETVFRYLILLQALFGDKLPTDTYCYFSNKFGRIVHPQSTFLTYLQYLVVLLKNKASVLLYLQAVLVFQLHLNQLFFQKKLYDISFLARLIEQSEFFKLSTYCLQSITVIYQLSLLVKDPDFKKDYQNIMNNWSSIMSRNECKQLQYFFAFREIKKIYPFMKERDMKDPIDRIKMIWDLIFKLIDKRQTKHDYIQMGGNKIIVDWRGDQIARKGIIIDGTLLRNQSFELFWYVWIQVKQKAYIISINNDRVIIENMEINQECRQTKMQKIVAKQYTVKELKKRPEQISFQIKIQSQTKKLQLYFKVQEFQISDIIEGHIMKIKIGCRSNAFLKSIMFKDVFIPGQEKNILNHITHFNRWQIKIASIDMLTTQSFGQKFDFDHAYCCIGQMLRYFPHISLPFAYDIFIRLSTKLIMFNNGGNERQMQVIVQVFNTIQKTYSNLRGRGKLLTPLIDIESVKQYPKSYYFLFVSAILPRTFWSTFTQDTKKQIANILKELQLHQQFRNQENKRLLLYDQCIEISKDHQFFFEVCEAIINNHEMNHILTTKFKKIIYYAREYTTFEIYLTNFLQDSLQFLNLHNQKYVDRRLRCKYLIVDSENERQLYTFFTCKSKTDLLHYYSQNQSFTSKGEPNYRIKQLIQLTDQPQKNKLVPWLLIDVQQLLFRDKDLKIEQRRLNFKVKYLYLQLLLMTRRVASNQQIDGHMDLTCKLIKKLQLSLQNDNSKAEMESVFHSTTMIDSIKEIIYEIIEKYGNINVYGKQDKVVQIFELIMIIIANFQKKNFLEFMIKYRYRCSHQCRPLKALIQYQKFKDLKLTHFSVFLQYLFEILLIIEQKSKLSYEQCQQLFLIINQYIEFILSSLDEKCINQKCNVYKALFYNYPRLAGHKEGMQDKNKVLSKMKRVIAIPFLELRGGIYFKCVLIIIKLIKLNPSLDYNNLVQYFLFGPKSYNKSKQNKAINRITSGQLLSPSVVATKERSPIESYISDVIEPYKLYFNKEDYPYNKINEETDLSTYITDFFLMSLAQFLHKNAERLQIQLLQKYTNSFLIGVSNQKVGKELLVSSIENYEIKTYDDVTSCLLQEKRYTTKEISPEKGVPTSPVRNIRRQISFEEIRLAMDKQFDTFSPKKRLTRKRTQDFSIEMKKRGQIMDLIRNDPRNWFKRPESKNIPLFFCQKAKEIRILELIHTHYVLKNQIVIQNPQTKAPNKDKVGKDAFFKKYLSYLNEQRSFLSGSKMHLDEKIRKVKKIFPYTSQKSPVLNIIQNCLGNMTCPVTLKITKKDYDIRRLKHNQSIYMNFYLNANKPEQESILGDELSKYNELNIQHRHIEEASIMVEQVDQEDVQQKQAVQIKQKPYCELITRQGSYFCQYKLETKSFILTSKTQRNISQDLWYLKLGTPPESLIKAHITLCIDPHDVTQILYRRFNQITNNSLQFFMKNGTSKFITFYRKENLSFLIKHLQKIFKGVKIVKDTTKEFEDLKYTQKWIQGNLTNFDYLMLINKYSGRTYNDLNQYYVFPWVLKDYHSEKIDLIDSDIYRDLSKPIGALNPQKLRRYLSKYKGESTIPQRCLYGSHYSTSLFVFYYLVRLQPFSSLHRDMQKGTWDAADRLFSSIDQVWDSLCNQSATSDIKECIPQFYYMPAFLRNIANIELGKKQCGQYVGDVQLPPWAKTAQQFVVTMRAALESDYVSENLHLWIDLIFGKHQWSEEKYNIFHPYSYSDPQVLTKFNSKNNKNIDGVICQISYFGQCPIQLFKKEHKPKKVVNQIRQARSTYNWKSEFMASQTIVGQAYILPGWKITKVYIENTEFVIQLQNVTKQEKQAAIISAHANIQALKESIQNIEDVRKNEKKGCSQPRLSINQRNQMLIGMQFLMDLDVMFNFQHTVQNQIWIACFGSKGIRIYNWQLQLYWSWQNEEVREVHLQATRLIFTTPNGKLYCKSFLDGKMQETVVFKDVCDMIIKVIFLPRLPGRDKSINYKILCIGDQQKVSIVSYSFEESLNFTSQSRSSIY